MRLRNNGVDLNISKGKVWINKNGVSKMIHPNQLQIYTD